MMAAPRCALRRTATHIAFGIAALGGPPLAAQSRSAPAVDTVTITQRVLVAGDVTPAEAKRQAVEKALAEAVRRVSGVRVQATQLGVGEDRNGRVRDSFLSVVQLDASGRATDYRVLDERFVSERHAALGAQLYFELRALVTVAAEHGASDPGFSVAVSLNDALFFDTGASLEGNDEVIATITSSQPAWLTVFGVAGDSAQLLLPNAFMTDGFTSADGTIQLVAPATITQWLADPQTNAGSVVSAWSAYIDALVYSSLYEAVVRIFTAANAPNGAQWSQTVL